MGQQNKSFSGTNYAPVLILLGVGIFIFSQVGNFSQSSPVVAKSESKEGLGMLRGLVDENALRTRSLSEMSKNLDVLRDRLREEVAKSQNFQTKLAVLADANSRAATESKPTRDPEIDSLSRRLSGKGIVISRSLAGEIRVGGSHLFQEQGIFVTGWGRVAVKSVLKIARSAKLPVVQIVAQPSDDAGVAEFTANRMDVMKRMLMEMPETMGMDVQLRRVAAEDLAVGDVELRFPPSMIAASYREGRPALR
ncbi:MAG: hypothetical protein JST16_00640 [Bdellovibrionales bacterium]|nr:hypothetical protein [Bdellovibrionales bacterium]